jgi:alkanesulfonate monooxygenase SsuD/methylene tetrahydromethanopterin reductase-like flavin-dependent oxidoreductase (luciferase family)
LSLLKSDKLDIDLITIQDHPYNGSFLDTWTFTALAMFTRHIHFMTNVAGIPLRHPPLLAKSAATLDILTKGHVEIGIGAGAFWRAIVGSGGPSRTPQEAVSALEEAIQVIRLIWNNTAADENEEDDNNNNTRATFHGKFYNLNGAQTGPQPFHPLRIWVGALGPRMLKLTGLFADGWTVSYNYVLPQKIPEMHKIIDESAIASRRKPNNVRRNYNLAGKIVLDEEFREQSQSQTGLNA